MRRTTFLLASLLCIGCDGGDHPETDAGPITAACDVPTDLTEATANTENAGNMTFEPAALDYACLDNRTIPTGGAPVDLMFHLVDFQDDFDVPNAEIWLFSDNTIANDCAGPNCQTLTTDDTGHANAMLPAGGWYAYRVLPFDDQFSRMNDIFAVFQYNEPAPAADGGQVQGNSVNGVTIDLIPSLLGISRTDGLAIVAGRVQDCQEQFVQNAVVRIYDPEGNCIEEGAGNDDPHIHYFNGDASNNLPDLVQTESNADGLYLIVQVQPDPEDRPFRVEAWANLGGVNTRIACETARIFPDAVTILNMDPLRQDLSPECE